MSKKTKLAHLIHDSTSIVCKPIKENYVENVTDYPQYQVNVNSMNITYGKRTYKQLSDSNALFKSIIQKAKDKYESKQVTEYNQSEMIAWIQSLQLSDTEILTTLTEIIESNNIDGAVFSEMCNNHILLQKLWQHANIPYPSHSIITEIYHQFLSLIKYY